MSDDYDVELTEEHIMLRDMVRKFADKEIAPVADQDENDHRFQRELVNQMAELGLFGCPVPEEYGGNNMGYLAHAIVTEEIGRVSGSLRVAFNMQTMGTAMSILKWGSDEVKKKYIPELMSAKMLGCFGITEPDAGSDTAAMSTTAVRDGDHYILNGRKMWITWAPVADMSVIFAMTDKSSKHRGMSVFVMDMHSPGVSTLAIKDKLGLWACPTGEIIMEDVKVPAGNRLGRKEKASLTSCRSLSARDFPQQREQSVVVRQLWMRPLSMQTSVTSSVVLSRNFRWSRKLLRGWSLKPKPQGR